MRINVVRAKLSRASDRDLDELETLLTAAEDATELNGEAEAVRAKLETMAASR